MYMVGHASLSKLNFMVTSFGIEMDGPNKSP